MIRLGHIDYSNCVPVHALLLEREQPSLELVRDVPSALNRALAAGTIDAAPCSSIEYARHSGEYRVLPAHAIGSVGAVHSILLESTVPLEMLDGRTVALPTASATSVVLLRALLELQRRVQPAYIWYDQTSPTDPIDADAAAVLRIGDAALRRTAPAGRPVFDLGAEWHAWTRLPFAFAVWQVRRDLSPPEVARLVRLLARSRAYFNANARMLSDRYAAHFDLRSDHLLAYWRGLRYDLDPAMQRGLLHFFELAAELGEAPACNELDIVTEGGG